MTARTHDAFAFASLITFAVFFPPENLNLLTLSAAIVGNIVGALIPDMDQASNRLWDLLPMGDHLAKVFRRLFYKHRTLSHSILGMVIIYKLLDWGLPQLLNPTHVDSHIVFVSVMIGYASHLLADSLTKEGLPLFFPLPFEIGIPPIRYFRITTGKFVENFLVLPGVGLYILFFIREYQSELVTILRLVIS